MLHRRKTKLSSESDGIYSEWHKKIRDAEISFFNLEKQYFSMQVILVSIILLYGIFPGLIVGCEGSVTIKPNSTVVLVGSNASFHCTSNLKDQPIWWYHSGARQQEVKQVSDESSIKDEFKGRFEVSVPRTNSSEKDSILTITRTVIGDAGSIYCKDDGDFGTYELAKLSVATNIHCLAACVEDHLLVTCSTCYWGEDDLVFVLLQHTNIQPKSSFRTYSDAKMCIEYEALWDIKMTCQNINQEQIKVILKENSTGVALEPHTSLVVLVKDQEISVTKLSQASDRTVSSKSDEIQTEKSKDFNNNEHYNTFIIIIIAVVLFAAVVISITMHYLIYRRWRKRKGEQSRGNDIDLQHRNANGTIRNIESKPLNAKFLLGNV